MRAGGACALSASLLLAGCSPDDNDPGPGGVSVGEARALDEAAAMLDEQRITLPPTDQPTGDVREEVPATTDTE